MFVYGTLIMLTCLSQTNGLSRYHLNDCYKQGSLKYHELKVWMTKVVKIRLNGCIEDKIQRYPLPC